VTSRPVFYVDRCLGKTVARELRAAGAVVEIHDDHFPQAVADADWIPHVAARGWVILTKDKNIRRARGERDVVVLSEARVFSLSSGNMRGTEMADVFVRQLADMEQIALALVPPFMAVVDRGGISVVYPALPPDRAS